MHLIYLAARIYPYWALAVAIILVQIGIYFRRRKLSTQYTCFASAGGLVIGIVMWFAMRGDIHSDHWVRAILGG